MRLVEHAKQVLHQADSLDQLDWKMKIFIDVHSFFSESHWYSVNSFHGNRKMFTLSFLFLKFKETTSLAPVTNRPKRNGWEDDYEVVEDFLPRICYGDDPVKCLGPRSDFWGNATTTSQNSRYVAYQCLSMLINHQLYCIWTPFPCLRNWFLTWLIPSEAWWVS